MTSLNATFQIVLLNHTFAGFPCERLALEDFDIQAAQKVMIEVANAIDASAAVMPMEERELAVNATSKGQLGFKRSHKKFTQTLLRMRVTGPYGERLTTR